MHDDSLVGALFAGRFQIESLLGVGGMGAVYLAKHTVLNRHVAVKVIRRTLITDLTIAARFRREARAASRVEHPHIISVFDYGHTTDGRPYLVMEYVEGATLARVLAQSGPMSVSRALGILEEIANALSAAHDHLVIHRDLKPMNILLTVHRGQLDYVKVLDFGMAKMVDVETLASLTLSGRTFGTPPYMSPEQCTDGEMDSRTDIYSFGILGYELLVGRVPFKGAVVETIRQHVMERPLPPSEASGRRELAPLVDQLILKCLAKNPDDRYASAQELVRALQDLRRGLGLAPLISLRTGDGVALDEVSTVAFKQHQENEPTRRVAAAKADPDFDEDVPTIVGKYPRASESMEGSNPSGPNTQELASSLRDRGLGTVEISLALAKKLKALERHNSVETQMEVLQNNLVSIERSGHQRESWLWQALIQLEYELKLRSRHREERMIKPGGEVEVNTITAQINEEILSLTKTMQRLSLQTENKLSTLQEMIDPLQENLKEKQEELELHERRLQELIREALQQEESRAPS